MSTRIYCGIHNDCKTIREAVFMAEQGFKNEFDDIDERAYHAVLYDGKKPVATGRLFSDKNGDFIIGRIAVMKEYRGLSLGSRVVRELEKQAEDIGAKSISLSAQCRVQEFYEKIGYTATDDIHDDEGCPHVTMTKIFNR
ncbi:MAG: GNAT family N-acetyltransferase [Ruminococcus sp.]|nr:GNAT family N-acetyltransferase [Ruminococcus sp.]